MAGGLYGQVDSLPGLTNWAHAVLSPSLHIYRSSMGFAVAARREIERGEALVRVPRSVALTADGAVGALPELLNRSTEAHVSLAMWLVQLMSRPPPGPVGGYYAALASAEVDCTLRWAASDLKHLQASSAGRRARALQRWADSEWDRVRGRAERPAFNASAARFRWALCAVWSRSFQLRCADETCGGAAGASGGLRRVFAPGADLLNHEGAESNAALDSELEGARVASVAVGEADDELELEPPDFGRGERDDIIVIRANRPLEPGEEVTIDYGPRPNADLLTTHGFALPGELAVGRAPDYEAMPIVLEPSDTDKHADAKRTILAAGVPPRRQPPPRRTAPHIVPPPPRRRPAVAPRLSPTRGRIRRLAVPSDGLQPIHPSKSEAAGRQPRGASAAAAARNPRPGRAASRPSGRARPHSGSTHLRAPATPEDYPAYKNR